LLVEQEENFIGSVKKQFNGIKQGVTSRFLKAKKNFDKTYTSANKQIPLPTRPNHKSDMSSPFNEIKQGVTSRLLKAKKKYDKTNTSANKQIPEATPPNHKSNMSSPKATASQENIRESKSNPKLQTVSSKSSIKSDTDSDPAESASESEPEAESELVKRAANTAERSGRGKGSMPGRLATPDFKSVSGSGSESASESESESEIEPERKPTDGGSKPVLSDQKSESESESVSESISESRPAVKPETATAPAKKQNTTTAVPEPVPMSESESEQIQNLIIRQPPQGVKDELDSENSEPETPAEYNTDGTEAGAARGKDAKPVNGVTNNNNSDGRSTAVSGTRKYHGGSPDTGNMKEHSVETQELANLLHAYKQKRETDAGPVLTIDIPLQQCLDK